MGEKTILAHILLEIFGGAYERNCACSARARPPLGRPVDLKSSHYVVELEDAGIQVSIGPQCVTIDADVIVTSTAIPETTQRLRPARELSIPIRPRA